MTAQVSKPYQPLAWAGTTVLLTAAMLIINEAILNIITFQITTGTITNAITTTTLCVAQMIRQ